MTTLFNLPPCDSPRLRWMKKHNVETRDDIKIDEYPESAFFAWSGDLNDAIDNVRLGSGDTELDAITDWAIKNGVRLWNEEKL
jgi:hypothetical protein